MTVPGTILIAKMLVPETETPATEDKVVIPKDEEHNDEKLLGTRMVLNEVITYIGLGAQKAALSPRSFIIATFALCGFANMGSIGMQIGSIGVLAPGRRNDLARLGVHAMFAGTMANLISASTAGIFLG
jgi:concentrative nucleoside transporter, CNT family